MKVYNKLVRDKIPEIIIQNGDEPITRILDDEEYFKELNVKLKEEVNEYLKEKDIEEVADIMEVIYAIIDYLKVSKDDLEKIRVEKAIKRGAFKEKIFLEKTLEKIDKNTKK